MSICKAKKKKRKKEKRKKKNIILEPFLGSKIKKNDFKLLDNVKYY